MKRIFFPAMLCCLLAGCANNQGQAAGDASRGKLQYFNDFKIIDSILLELGDVGEDWNSVMDACLGTLDKKILFVDDDHTVEVYPDNTELIKTAGGETIFVEDPLHTVTYSRAPVRDGFDEFRYFEVFCHDFKKIDYGGRIRSQTLSKPSGNEVIRIIGVERRFFHALFPEKQEIEYVFFEKEQGTVFLRDYLFECPPEFDASAFLSLWKTADL